MIEKNLTEPEIDDRIRYRIENAEYELKNTVLYTFLAAKGKGQSHKVTLDKNTHSAISLLFIIPSFSNLTCR